MERQFENIVEIIDKGTFDKVRAYYEEVIQYATKNGYLSEMNANNEYTAELGRVGRMIADYESIYMDLSPLKFKKTPLIASIEKEMRKKDLNQRQTAEILEIKENTFSQIMSGKRNVSMKLAKKLYKVLKIDPKTILEFA